MFKKGIINDVIIKKIQKYVDDRGWLAEIYRLDEIDESHTPVMSYVSQTYPGVARGPHEHVSQTDYFAFVGPSNFKLYLWDNRRQSATYGNRMVVFLGEDAPGIAIIPPGVVHAYKNIGTTAGWVFNAPNQLYAGKGKKEKVDEIRHEDKPDSPFLLD